MIEPKFTEAFFSLKHNATKALPKRVMSIKASHIWMQQEKFANESNDTHNSVQTANSTALALPDSTITNLNVNGEKMVKYRFIATLDSSFNFTLFYPEMHVKIRRGRLLLNNSSELDEVSEMGQKVAICKNAAVVAVPWDPALYFYDLDFINKSIMSNALERVKEHTHQYCEIKI